jgi:DNA-binding NtrC family response regulator
LLGNHPNTVLLMTDVVMPGMKGRKLAEEALRRRPDLKVLFTTGYTRNAIVHNGTLDDAVQRIVKPFTLDGLAAKIAWVLARRLSGSLRGTGSGPLAWFSGIGQRRLRVDLWE